MEITDRTPVRAELLGAYWLDSPVLNGEACCCAAPAAGPETGRTSMLRPATLAPQAKASRSPGTFRRRVFWLLPHDRDTQPEGLYKTGAPAEAVDPRTLVRPAHPRGRHQGGPAGVESLPHR